MKFVLVFVICVATVVRGDDYSDDYLTEQCCDYGISSALSLASVRGCARLELMEDVEPEQAAVCQAEATTCCEDHFTQKDECTAGTRYAAAKQCSVPTTDAGKTCCDECTFGILAGESQRVESCGGPAETDTSPITFLRKNAYYQCCLEAVRKPEPTPRATSSTSTSTARPTTARASQKCKPGACEQICNDEFGIVQCECHTGYRLQGDKKSCKDVNECAESTDNLCELEDHLCHNTPGSFKCVPIKKRDLGLSCPPGFKKNTLNQVCDDVNECQLPRPPCPKYLCENTIGGYKCSGKPGKPIAEDGVTQAPGTTSAPKDICPRGFRAGANDECVDIDECEEHLDDCQRLSQHCINTHGDFFCQDHVSKRCTPGFKVNDATGICEDIDECEESSEVCKSNQVCINLPGAYDCKSKISTLPKLTTKTCQEGTRMRIGSGICEDINECREGTHLCDKFQNCINTFGGHECRCKNGFELDTSSGACVDIDECALKLDNCPAGQNCLNVLGSYTCTRRTTTTSTTTTTTTTTTTPAPGYEDEYYDTDDENTTNEVQPDREKPISPPVLPNPKPTPPKPTSPKPTSPKPVPGPNYPRPNYPRPNTPRPTSPTTTSSTTTTTSTTTTPKPAEAEPPTQYRPRPTQYPPPNPTNTRPFTNRPQTTTEKPYSNPKPNGNESGPEYGHGDVNVPPNRDPINREPNVNDKDKEPKDFNATELHCINGFEKNARGECVDINECHDRHTCSSLETCKNEIGSYRCECIAGFMRDGSHDCVVIRPTTANTPRPPPRTISTTTASPTSVLPWSPPRNRPQSSSCEMGFSYSSSLGRCVDTDECAIDLHTCLSTEKCVNNEGGYICEKLPNVPTPTQPAPRPRPGSETNTITVGAQYGQRGPRLMRPTYSRLPNSGAIAVTCPWGYKQTRDKLCMDIDECSRNISECGPRQRCENFYGGYSCQCPAGHRLLGQADCEDVNECLYGNPCPYTAQCVNTPGSYRCECSEGFRNAPTNDKVCVDVDECSENPSVCHQGCANTWGSYRCHCDRGYRLNEDNKCVDVDECAEWGASRGRGRLCGGECLNTPGSYRCTCPSGYRLAEDQRSCIDIDECDTGVATCARSSNPGEVCQNTRGSYHCHTIDCPPGYQLEGKHRCSRVQRSCLVSDRACLHQPSSYSYNFITFVANIYIPNGSVDLFTMHGPAWTDTFSTFEMGLVSAKAARGVRPADLTCFDLRPSDNMCVVSLLCPLEGPQVAELELTMSLHRRGQFAGSAVARLVVIVSQYEF